MGEECAQQKWHGTGMQILADFKSDFHFFLEWRRDVFGDHLFTRIVCGECLEINLFGWRGKRRRDALFFESLHENGRGKSTRLGNGIGSHRWLVTDCQAAC